MGFWILPGFPREALSPQVLAHFAIPIFEHQLNLMEGIDDSHRLAFAANHLEVFDNILGVSNEAVEDADLDVGDVPDLESKYGRFYKITTKEVDASSDEWIIIPNTFENNLIDGCQRMRK